MKTKICTKCGEEKNLDLFSADKSKKDGKRSQCKECAREYGRKWRRENPEKVTEIKRKRKLENPEKAGEIKRKSVRKSVRELKPSYVKGLLRDTLKIPASEITPLDIKEKREQIQYHRQIKLLTKQLKQNENKS